jgi:glycolate oxidase FAD binding subunit
MTDLTPQTEAELADMIRGATAPLTIRGGGTRGVPGIGQRLSTAALSGIRLYEPGGLTLVAGAGTPIAELDTILAEKGQRLGFEPMDHRALMGTTGTPTLGGVAAANIAGPRRIQAGACRDFMLGIRMVDGQGNVIANGGRVMKNVTGYDMVKLMAGSYGTLGVLTEISLKVQAIPQAEATLILRDQSMAQACADLRAALATPWDVSGAAYVDAGLIEDHGLRLIRIEGMAGSVAYRAQSLRDRLGADEVIETEESRNLWARIRDVRDLAPDTSDRHGNPDNAFWRISLRPTAGPDLHEYLSNQSLTHAILADWGGGLLWLRTPATGDAGAGIIRDFVTRSGGHATLTRAPEALRQQVPMFHPEPSPVARITQGLRQTFAPRARLNPGLMGTPT